MKKQFYIVPISIIATLFLCFTNSCDKARTATITTDKQAEESEKEDLVSLDTVLKKSTLSIDTADYNKRIFALSNNDTTGRWPVKTAYPLPGSILPYNRIIAFYGNLYSKRMGILGELPKKEMLQKLQNEVAKWQSADASVKTIPALHYIAITAQSSHGKNNKHRLRMPFHQIDTVLSWAKSINALVFLDIQVGQSTINEEVPTLQKYLMMPNVHLGIDPEFSMKNGETPGTKIGTFSADDINDAIDFLTKIVRENKLPPKVLVVHRFTQRMLTNYKKIKIVPEVQVVINMDGFGDKILKKSTYKAYIYREPVQFTGFKLFYKNDTKTNRNGLYTPEELLKFTPKPIYIQYQ
nr:hypothetical protein [uncultured Flavobacterium sp.]